MIRLFKTQYLKSRVITLSYQIDKVMAEYAKQGLEDTDEKFLEEDPMKFYECNFVSHIVTKWNADRNDFSEGEWHKYNEGLKKMEEYRNMRDFVKNISDFHWELKNLYTEVTKELSTPNAWSRRENTTRTFEIDTQEALKKYSKLLHDLKDYPEWQDKVKNETGFYVHLLYNSLNHEEQFAELFASFDPQYFFK